MTRRLVITDHYDSRAFEPAADGARGGDAVDVLLLGLSAEWFRWQHAQRAADLAACRLLDASALAEAAHANVRSFVVDFTARLPRLDLGGETLESLLREEDGNAWWYLETSEKGPYRGPLIAQLYALAVVRAAMDRERYDGISYCLRDDRLRDVLRAADQRPAFTEIQARRPRGRSIEDWPILRYCLHAALAAGRLAGAWALPRATAPPDGAMRGRTLIFTAFPAWWTDAIGPAARERFFSAARRSEVGGYLALVTSPGTLLRHRAAVRRIAREHGMLFLQHFVSLRDAATICAPRRLRRLIAFERRWRAALRARFAGFEVGPLIARDITRSLSGGEPFQDVLLGRAARRAVTRLAPSAIVYRAEFQPSENALLRGTAGQATRIGFVHFPFGENYLPTQFAPGEVSGYLSRSADTDARPWPEGFITSGEALAEHLVAGGFPRERVALCGPLRYEALIRYREATPRRPELRARLALPAHATIVLVALAIVEADTEALFGALVDACGRIPGDLHLLVRTHPNRPAGDPALATTLAALGAGRASLVSPGASVYDYIAASDAMVCIGSMIAFEAMALGVMPIAFDNPATYGAVSLAEYREGLFVVRSGSELRAAIQDVIDGAPAAGERRRAWPRLLRRVLGDLDRPPAGQFAKAIAALSGQPARAVS